MSTINAIALAPCKRCPWRKDVPIYLRPDRRQEIVDSLAAGHDFYCHETLATVEDDEGESDTTTTTTSQICAGAAKALLEAGGSTNLMRIVERLHMADLARTEQRGTEVWSLSLWPELEEGSTGDSYTLVDDEDDVPACNTVNAGCLAPAGYMGAAGYPIRGTEPADLECPSCGEPVCSACADSEGRCGTCTEEEDDE